MINGKYSLTKYSANIGSSVPVEFVAIENLRGVCGSTVFISVDVFASENLICNARLTASIITEAEAVSQLLGSANMLANVDVSFSSSSDMLTKVQAIKDLGVEFLSTEDLKSISHLSTDRIVEFSSESSMKSLAKLVKDIQFQGEFATEVLLASVGGGKVENQIVTINASIPPGGELRINSENFTVLLNGENILYAQEGTWPILSRELAKVTIDSGSGGTMTGEVVFTERWL